MIDAATSENGATDFRKTKRYKHSMVDSTADRLPPSSSESECGVLGCMMLSPLDCIPEVVEVFKAGKEVLYDLRHQEIFQAMIDLYESQCPVDLISIQYLLKNKGLLESVGGIAYLSSLPDTVPSASSLSYYAEIVHEKYVLRKMIHACTDAVSLAYEHEGDVDGLLATVEGTLQNISRERDGQGRKTIREATKEVIADFQTCYENKGQKMGLSTGFNDIDYLTTGLHPTDFVLIAARPAFGKTSLALNMAESIAIGQNQPVGIISMEMTTKRLVARLICSCARINGRELMRGNASERDFVNLMSANKKVSAAPIFIDDESGLSAMRVKAKIRRMVQQEGIKVAFIDYLGLIVNPDIRGNNINHVNGLTDGFKNLAKELNIAIVGLMQLNRDIEKDKTRKPRMSDLRDGGEQAPDIIAIGHSTKKEDDYSDGESAELCIVKNRNGPTGDVPLFFLKSFTRFESAARIDARDIPETSRPHND